MDQIVAFHAGNEDFMGSVLVARGDEVVFKKSYGSANLEWNVPNTATTKFRLGSVTKQFTAAAILLLEEGGKLKTSDPVRVFLADAPPAWNMSATRFFFRNDEAEVEFEQDSAGTVTGLVIHSPDGKYAGNRIAERAEVTLPIEILSQYPGTYELSPGFDVMISLEDGKLISQATGQSKIPIYAEAEDKFFTKAMNAQLHFVKDNNGRVGSLVLHQGGRDMKAPKK